MFRAKTVSNSGGGFGSSVTIAGYAINGEPQVFAGELDEDLGFGVPPVALVTSDEIAIETLAGLPWPGSSQDRNGQGPGKLRSLHALRDGVWPDERELTLQANVGAKHDPKTRAATLRQLFVKGQRMTPAQADEAVARALAPPDTQGLLDGVKPIVPRARPVPKSAAAETADAGESPADAQAAREAKAKGKGKGRKAG